MQRVVVLRDRRVQAVGVRLGDVVAYDWGWVEDGTQYVQRSFILLDDGIQINQPVRFPPAQRGWWYCDVVLVTSSEEMILVDDAWVDIIVGPPDHPYRVLDLDELAQALRQGRISQEDSADVMIRTQRFLDRRLNRRHETVRTWPDFPPQDVVTLMAADLPQDWSWL